MSCPRVVHIQQPASHSSASRLEQQQVVQQQNRHQFLRAEDVESESESDEERAVYGCCTSIDSYDYDAVLELQMRSPYMPVEIRLDFVKKVYALMFAMLVLSSGIAVPFVVSTDKTLAFMKEHSWIPLTCYIFLIAQNVINTCVLLCSSPRTCYIQMFKVFPINVAFMFTYAACWGVVIGYLCTTYEASSVGIVFAVTAIMMAALSIYAVVTETDFTGWGMYVLVLLIGLIFLVILTAFFPDRMFHKIVSALIVVVFGFVIIHDTQLIVGTAKYNINSSAVGNLQFTIDMYAFAAYQLYLDFLNVFLNLLRIFGGRRS